MPVVIAGYRLDMADEDHSFDAEVTEHPVERGSDIADHIRSRPIVVKIDGVVSDTPIGPVESSRSGSTSLPSEDAQALLLGIREAREPVTIETSLGVYANMALQSYSVPRNARNGEALRFSATFKQVRYVSTERTSVRVSVPRASKKKKRGSKPSEEKSLIGSASGSTNTNTDGSQSILNRVFY